jgi:hypothetical protein
MVLTNTENELSERLCSRLHEHRKPKQKTGSTSDLFPGREFMPRNLICSIHTGEYSWSMVLKNTENELSERLCSRLQEYRKPKLHSSKPWFGK